MQIIDHSQVERVLDMRTCIDLMEEALVIVDYVVESLK